MRIRNVRADRERRTPAAVAIDIGLTLAAAGGVVCVVLVVAASMFHITLIMFSTGSMSPTIPTGSLAVVREIVANEIRVGDVITVDRDASLPITHRVTSVSPLGNGSVSLTMKGDANEEPDPAPYVIDRARIVIASVPQLAYVVVAISHPLVMGGITIAAGILVTWAFWPRGGSTSGGRRVRSRRSAHRALPGGATVVLIVGLASVQLLGSPTPAQAVETDTIVEGTYLTLTSIGDPDELGSLSPGRPVGWQIGVEADAPPEGLIHLGISATGDLAGPGGLDVDVRSCDVRWVNDVCPTGFSWWLTEQGLVDAIIPTAVNGSREMTAIPSTAVVWILVRVTMPAGTPPGATANVRLSAWGAGDSVSIGAPGELLAPTGVSIGSSIALAAGSIGSGLVLAGIAAVVSRRQSRREHAS